MRDVSRPVAPKFGLCSLAMDGGTIAVRYFMPWKAHPTMAFTGAQCIASCALTPGTVADRLLKCAITSPVEVVHEHDSGAIDILVDFSLENGFSLISAGLCAQLESWLTTKFMCLSACGTGVDQDGSIWYAMEYIMGRCRYEWLCRMPRHSPTGTQADASGDAARNGRIPITNCCV